MTAVVFKFLYIWYVNRNGISTGWTSVFQDPLRACGLSLLCQNWISFVEYAMPSYRAEWDAGLSGVQDQSVHRAQEHRWVSPGDNPHIACQAGFHSYFTSKLWATLVSQLHFV
ncbi:Lipoyl synthase [Dissostichus eleginoides]|uniref:Lipoyl synthase n=1 Tax=Dissostichus eleginoides TaxID=100907 RepID=A0AAD9EYP4_DISEL|nr:Lipoyl synthase [Dissostichus eleginoides]